MLYPATTIAMFNRLIPRYVQLRGANAVLVASHQAQIERPGLERDRMDNFADAKPALRCFNCSGLGHIAAHCPKPRRMPRTCFRCGSAQHTIRDCTKPAANIADQVALTDKFQGDSDGTQRFLEVNNVSVTFQYDVPVTQCNMFTSLFDTGSPISLMRRSSLPLKLSGESTYSGFSGIGHFKLCTFGKIPTIITFRNLSKVITLYIVSDYLLPYPLLLGRDFLCAFDIGLSMYHLIPNSVLKPEIILNVDSDLNKIMVSNDVLHCAYLD